MSALIDKIVDLDTTPLNQDEEYQFTSNFLEWFYTNMYRKEAFSKYPILYSVSKDPEYNLMCNLCTFLINIQYAKNFDNETRHKIYDDMKRWTVKAIKKYSSEDVLV